jgi:glycosyltransferase involved in cell wall biosynthesis
VKNYIFKFGRLAVQPFLLVILLFSILIIRIFTKKKSTNHKIVWGGTPIISYAIFSKSMNLAGYHSETIVKNYYSINNRNDWDSVVSDDYSFFYFMDIKIFFAFIISLIKYDIFFISCDGFLLNQRLYYLEFLCFKFLGKKLVVIPYGSDAFVYRRLASNDMIHVLLTDYHESSRQQNEVAKRLDFWMAKADVVVPGLIGPEGLGRWDVLIPNSSCIDLDDWKSDKKFSNFSNGSSGEIVIAHAPNHRFVKGTEFIFDAINNLIKEGYKIRFKIIEKTNNNELRKIFKSEVDIYIDQLILHGHGLAAIESMACSVPTICNLEDQAHFQHLRRWSYFNECPLISASPENLVDVLRKLIVRVELRHQLGKAGRKYVEKYHGLDSAQYLFINVINYALGKKKNLINLYHPLLGEYPNRLPKIQHPLVNNRIVD